MSKNAFSLANQPVSRGLKDEDPAVKIKKVSSKDRKIENEGEKLTGGDSGPSYSFTGVTPGKIYMHPPTRLINGRILYRCKYLGHLRVAEPRGTELVKGAIDKLLTVAEVNKANLDEDLKEVDLSVSIRSLVTVDTATKKALHQHPLPLISFSADDKRQKGNMFAYISRGKPPASEHICYVYQCSATQAKEITATVGQAFELAYKKFLETKQAQEDFKRLKTMLQTATPEQKVEIEKKLIEVNKIRAAEAERQKKMAVIQSKMPEPYVKPVTKITVKGTKGVGLYTGSGKDSSAMFEGGKPDPQLAEDLEMLQKEVKQLEIESEHQRQAKKMVRNISSVEAKWEKITEALEPFQLEPTTQYLVKRLETKELDLAIEDIEKQIEELELAFDWRRRKGQGPVPSLYDYTEEEIDSPAQHVMEDLDSQIKATQISADAMEIPDLPANYVMDEFIKARERAAMPKKGTVKTAAGGWYLEHHD